MGAVAVVADLTVGDTVALVSVLLSGGEYWEGRVTAVFDHAVQAEFRRPGAAPMSVTVAADAFLLVRAGGAVS